MAAIVPDRAPGLPDPGPALGLRVVPGPGLQKAATRSCLAPLVVRDQDLLTVAGRDLRVAVNLELRNLHKVTDQVRCKVASQDRLRVVDLVLPKVANRDLLTAADPVRPTVADRDPLGVANLVRHKVTALSLDRGLIAVHSRATRNRGLIRPICKLT